MRLAFHIAATLALLPFLLTTGLLQDAWLLFAYAQWAKDEPFSYWATRLAALGVAVWCWRRLRRAA